MKSCYWEKAYWRLVPSLMETLTKVADERDAAKAHDQQPYPTAWAYEQACAARDDWMERARLAEERLTLAREALVATGYFTKEEVGPDAAPRITELWSHARLDIINGVRLCGDCRINLRAALADVAGEVTG